MGLKAKDWHGSLEGRCTDQMGEPCLESQTLLLEFFELHQVGNSAAVAIFILAAQQ